MRKLKFALFFGLVGFSTTTFAAITTGSHKPAASLDFLARSQNGVAESSRAERSAEHFSHRMFSLALKSNHEVHRAFATNPTLQSTTAAQDLADIVHAGQRAYDWIIVLNRSRPAGQKPLSYSDPSTTTSPSIEHPKIYNGEIARQMYNDIVAQMPAAYRTMIEGNTPLPPIAPVSDADFIALGLKTTLAYDTAVRWIMMQDYLADYTALKTSDMRGYYALKNLKDRDQKLAAFAKLAPSEQKAIHEALVDVCLNNQDPSAFDAHACETEVTNAENTHALPTYYSTHIGAAQALWDSFFELDSYSVRADLVWTSQDPNTLHYPFLQPTSPTILAYLRDNVEDEWHLGSWHLHLDFVNQSSRPDLSHLEYQPGVTPHEETNKIVMDENEPLTEYLTQWTIRHEFGHLLGFKDCYVEFYDESLKAMVNYPLDPTNLMCSRRGHLQPQHFDVLKAAYFKP